MGRICGRPKRSGSPCRATCLEGRDHCQWHGPRCNGTTKAGTACMSPCLKSRNHCKWHGPKCKGMKLDGTPCNSRAIAQLDWEYCRDEHRPMATLPTPPREFRVEDILVSKGAIVKEYRNGIDAYSMRRIPLLSRKELDHVVELHLVRDAFDSATRYSQGNDFKERKKKLQSCMKDLTNQAENLNFTSQDINRAKFEAFDAFSKDFKHECGDQNEFGLFPYLTKAAAKDSGYKLGRNETRNIQKEVRASYDFIENGLQKDDDPLFEKAVGNLHGLFTAMRLL